MYRNGLILSWCSHDYLPKWCLANLMCSSLSLASIAFIGSSITISFHLLRAWRWSNLPRAVAVFLLLFLGPLLGLGPFPLFLPLFFHLLFGSFLTKNFERLEVLISKNFWPFFALGNPITFLSPGIFKSTLSFWRILSRIFLGLLGFWGFLWVWERLLLLALVLFFLPLFFSTSFFLVKYAFFLSL